MNLKAALLAVPLATALVACPPPAATPDFTIASAAPSSLSFAKPATGNPAPQTVTVTITPTGGFADAVTLSLVAPAASSGVTGSGSIAAAAPSGTLTVTATGAASVGAAQAYQLQATSGSITRTLALPITVTAAPPPANTLGVSVGTYNIKSAGGAVTKGFAMVVRPRDSGNAIINGFATGVNYTVAGPTGWNGNVIATVSGPDDFIIGAANAFGVFRNPPGGTGFSASSAPINGTYTVTTTINSVQYSGTPQVTDATQVLPLPVVTASLSGTTVTSSWAAVAGASSYRVQLFKNGTVLSPLSSNQVTTGKTFTGLTVAGGDTFFVRVIAYPVNITATDVTLPAQFNISSTDQNAV